MCGLKTVNSERRDALIETYRDINVDHNWWEGTYEAFRTRMETVGISVESMYFSGFWSQGDGACFDGSLENLGKYMGKHVAPERFPRIRQLTAAGGDVYVHSEHTGHYCNEYSVRFWMDADSLTSLLPAPSEFHELLVEKWQEELDAELDAFEEEVADKWREYMGELYASLEKEYDVRTSGEEVWETIVANELHLGEEEGD